MNSRYLAYQAYVAYLAYQAHLAYQAYVDISALKHAYAFKIRLQESFFTPNKMVIKFSHFSNFSNNLGIRSEFGHTELIVI